MARLRLRAIFHLAMLVVGAIALGLLLDRIGWEATRRAIIDTGWWFGVIATIDLVSMLCDAFAVHGFLRNKADIRYWTVFGAQASGLAINRLTPANTLGEAVKVTMLSRHVPTSLAVSAIVSFNLCTIYLSIAMMVIGGLITALMLDLPDQVATLVWIAMGVLVAAAIILTVIVRRGAVSTLIEVVARIRLISRERAERWTHTTADIDTRLRQLGDPRSSGITRGLVGAFGSRVFHGAGTIAVLHAAQIPMTPSLVVASLSVGILITWISQIIPLGLGIADGTNYALYGLLGASPASGLVFTMVNRLRTVVLAMMGLAIMAIANMVHRASRSSSNDLAIAGARPDRSHEPP